MFRTLVAAVIASPMTPLLTGALNTTRTTLRRQFFKPRLLKNYCRPDSGSQATGGNQFPNDRETLGDLRLTAMPPLLRLT